MAVEGLDVGPDDEVFEIGCGRGIAAGLISERLVRGRLLAIDRSAKATAAAVARNPGHIKAGRPRFLTTVLEDVPAGAGPFDKVLAVNVKPVLGPAGADRAPADR